jgi:hypothetical protein
MTPQEIPLCMQGGTVEDVARESGSRLLAAKILQIFHELGGKTDGIALPVMLNRTHAGYYQRSAGAWSWYLTDAEGREIVGGYCAATDTVVAHRAGKTTLCICGDWYGSLPTYIDIDGPWWISFCDTRKKATSQRRLKKFRKRQARTRGEL